MRPVPFSARATRAARVTRANHAALASVAALVAFTACASRENNEDDGARLLDTLTRVEKRSGVPATVAGTLATFRDTLYAPRATCDVRAGATVTVHAFRDGFFKTSRPASCTTLGGDAAWVFAGALSLPASSYSGLTEVASNSAIAVAMNYAGTASSARAPSAW